MDANTILIALKHTQNHVDATRKEAEAHLKQWESAPGFLVLLLQIVASNEVEPAARQAGAINLKNLAKKWRPYEVDDPEAAPQLNFPDADRNVIKDNIVEALIHAPPAIQSQLASAIASICNADFPEKWENLIPKITHFIHSQNPAAMYGALRALLMALRKYNYISDGKKRAPLNQTVGSIFPLLLEVFSHLSSNDSIESAAIQRLICKIFYGCVNLGIPPYLNEPGVFEKWMGLFCGLLEKQIPDSIQPSDPDERAKFPWWSAKKWAARALERFIRRFAVKGMETFLRVVSVKRGGAGYLPDKFAQTAFCYLRMCLRYGNTFVALKPHIDVLTQEILFPYLSLSDADSELWAEDPVEYLRKEFDPIAEYNNPRTETINFITDYVMLRGREPLNKFMSFVVQLLIKYTNAPEGQRNYREKDGCLHAIGSLSPWLQRIEEYRNNLERMLLVHVFPEFSSPHGFLRARACWIFSQFHKVKFTNADNFRGAVQKVLSMMHDPDLPVRVQAGLSLRFLIFSQNIEELLRPLLPHILEAIFKLMNEIESDDLVATLETLIDKFGEEMAPYSVALVQRLTESFMKLYKSADENEEDDTAATAALECLMALRSLLRGVRNMPHIYAQVNPIIAHMLNETLNDNSIEYFEELLRILTFSTFYGDVTPMWSTFNLIYNAHDLWASDYIADMVPPIDNFISRGTETFLTGPYLDMTMNMYKKCVGDEKTDEQEAGQATELVESILHNCKGRVDRIIPDVVAVAAKRLASSCDSAEFKVLLIEVIANALYYNPVLTLQAMEAQGSTQAIFTQWLASIPSFKRQYDIKLVVLGLTALFEIPLNSLPPIIQQGAKVIMEALVKLLKLSEKLKKEAEERKLDREHELAVYKKEQEEKKASGKVDEEELEDDEEEQVQLNDIPDHEDAEADDSDDEDMEALLGGSVRSILGEDQPIDLGDESEEEAIVEGDDFEDDDDDEEDYDEDDEDDEDEEYITVIDKVDELVYFAARVHHLFGSDGSFQALVGTMGGEDQKEMQVLVEAAKTREQENAQKEQQRLLKLQQQQQQQKK